MKVAISVPDPIFRAADRLAKRMRVPRSQFYARAVESYLKQQARPDITERLNAVYGRGKNSPDPALLDHNLARLRRTDWDESCSGARSGGPIWASPGGPHPGTADRS